MHIVRLSTIVASPWRNGGGTTREVARCDREGRLLWRLSVAEVEMDGPFSDFAGLQRILTVTEGQGIDLIGQDIILGADRLVPLRFDGAMRVEGRLRDGPVRDLNLIFDPLAFEGDVRLVEGPADLSLTGPLQAVHALQGDIQAPGPLAPGDTAFGHGRLRLGRDAAALLVTLTPRAQSEALSLPSAAR